MCGQRVKSCDSSTDGWLVTQYISKTSDVNYPVTITVDIQGDRETSSCSSCTSNVVKVYYYPSDGAITSNAQLNTKNYNMIGSVSFGVSTQEKSVTFSLGGQYDRFYIAIVAENICFTLRRLLVSYEVCPTETVGLVIYPDTPIGTNADSSAKCKANAGVVPGGNLNITCNADRTFSGTPSCSCLGGSFQSGEACYREFMQCTFAFCIKISPMFRCTPG